MPRSALPPETRGTVLTVGTFDGVHLGHRAVLREVEERARRRGLDSVLLTFDRHPLSVVRPRDAPRILTTPDEKKEVLAQTGLDWVGLLPFTRNLSLYRPEEFVRRVLVERYRVRELVVGRDHGFGRSRSGDAETLRRAGDLHGFDVDVVPEVAVGGEPVSSTRIRNAVEEGRAADAAEALGRPYSFTGTVVRGSGRGRELGFPTANLRPPSGAKLLPGPGIYAVRASLRSGARDGLLHLGPRPTFDDAAPSVELYLLDFDGDLYGHGVRVDVLERLRDVASFASSDDLVAQMEEDRRRAREYFASRQLREPPPWRDPAPEPAG